MATNVIQTGQGEAKQKIQDDWGAVLVLGRPHTQIQNCATMALVPLT